MDDTTYQRWWQLHLRVAKGGKLNPSEQEEYDSGIEVLDQEEKEQFAPNGLAILRRLRAQIEQLQTIHAQLLAKSARLDEQIAALESGYQSLTGYALASETHASSLRQSLSLRQAQCRPEFIEGLRTPPKFESVRQRYQRACGYCGVTETTVGGSILHY